MSSIKKAIDYLISRLEKTTEGYLFTSTTDKRKNPYAEVTGYLIPTMMNLGYKEEAFKMVQWLVSVQNKNGSWDNFVFDTGMVLQGLKCFKGFEENIERGKKFIEENFNNKEFTHNEVPLIINYLALLQIEKEDKIGLPFNEFVDGKTMLHFYSYILEFVVNYYILTNNMKIEYINLIENIKNLQNKDGSIPAIYGQDWICYPAVAQMACLFYKCGFKDAGDKAIKYLESIQNKDGSFYGSNLEYFKDEKVLWATKYFIDAYLLKIKADFEARINEFPTEIDKNDDRYVELKNILSECNGKSILDCGCGRGRFALLPYEMNACISCVDLSYKMMNESWLRGIISYKQGSVLNIPYENEVFDFVYCIEVLEHSIISENAIKEMSRVLKKGGKLIIIDKNSNIQGNKEEWENWFTQLEVENIMKLHFATVKSKIFGINNMWVIWEGVK
jgi:malonyl-CoA O-methyltransferase